MTSSQQFDEMYKTFYSGVICDALDELGFRNQAMHERINPLVTEWVIVGKAKTVLAVDVHYIPENPYEMEIAAIDSILPNEVVIGCTNESTQNGFWGELLSTASKLRGAKGAVIDGLVRDTKKIIELNFPVFARGTKPVDSRGRGLVINYDCPVVCGGVLINPGDIIFADRDGVVSIPQQIFQEVYEIAFNKVTRENSSRKELLEGKLLRDVYNKYGVL